MNVLIKGLHFALRNKELPVVDNIPFLKSSIRNLPEEERNEFRCKVDMVLSKKSNIKSNASGLNEFYDDELPK